MRFAFIEQYRATWPITVMSVVLRVSRSGFYAWRKRPESERSKACKRLVEQIQQIHTASRRIYGSPRVHAGLIEAGESCCVNHVAKVMRDNGIRSKVKRKFKLTTDSKHSHPETPNKLDRQFEQKAPNQVWTADITFIPTGEGWLYLAIVMDLFSRMIVGWSMSSRMTVDLTIEALQMAIERRRPSQGVLHHSDRGSQYASGDYQRRLQSHRIDSSMSRKGDCWDNAPTESVIGTIKSELVSFDAYETRDAGRQSIFEYIEAFYNRERKHSALGYVSPQEYEARYERSVRDAG